MRVMFEDKELELLAYEQSRHTSKWSSTVTRAYRRRIQQLEAAVNDQDLRALKSLRLEKLKGSRAGTWSIRIDAQYRLILRFETRSNARSVIVIEALDYH